MPFHHNKETPVQKEYSQLAQEYDDKWEFYIQATLQETLKRIEVSSGERLLDIGSGTGRLLERLEQKYPELILSGIEPTQEMIEISKKRLSAKVSLEQAWAEELPFESDSFDILVSCNMFHYIQDPMLALKEAMRVLKPTGRIVITDWCDDYLSCQICDLLLRILNKAHFKTYKSTECLELLSSSGFYNIHMERYKINWLWGMMTATAVKENHTL